MGALREANFGPRRTITQFKVKLRNPS